MKNLWIVLLKSSVPVYLICTFSKVFCVWKKILIKALILMIYKLKALYESIIPTTMNCTGFKRSLSGMIGLIYLYSNRTDSTFWGPLLPINVMLKSYIMFKNRLLMFCVDQSQYEASLYNMYKDKWITSKIFCTFYCKCIIFDYVFFSAFLAVSGDH